MLRLQILLNWGQDSRWLHEGPGEKQQHHNLLKAGVKAFILRSDFGFQKENDILPAKQQYSGYGT